MFTWCNERKGNTRCEGCQRLYCLPCVGKHHDELAIQFELLIGVQKELKEAFNVVESTWQNKKEHPCLIEIDQWEQAIINRIRQIAEKARTTANEMMMKNMSDIRRRLDQLAFDMQERQQEGNYLDDDISAVKKQLEKLNNTVANVNDKIRVSHTATNKIDWDSLLHVTTDKKSSENRFHVVEFHYDQEDAQDKIWNNLRKLIRSKHTTDEYKNKQATFKRNTTSFCEPTVLTSFDSSPSSLPQRVSYLNRDSTIFNNFQHNSFLNENESFDDRNSLLIDHDHFLPQASDA